MRAFDSVGSGRHRGCLAGLRTGPYEKVTPADAHLPKLDSTESNAPCAALNRTQGSVLFMRCCFNWLEFVLRFGS
jgi:hypothetical protein